ncbi:MAG: aldo/keto reductase, partial [Planctomycetota bacterium]
MRYRKLGRTDIEVSVICQGCWSLVTEDFNWGHNELRDSIDAIRTSMDAGVNFFDTAEGYGRGESEQILARALGDLRKDVVIATKVSRGNLAPEAVREHCDRSLRRLGTDYIDLYQIHWPHPKIPVADTLGAMEALRDEGKIRAIGVSNFGVSYMRDLFAAGRGESNQVCYSLLWRPIEHAVQPMCVEKDMNILCYSPIAQGLLTGKFSSVDDIPDKRVRTRLFSSTRPNADHGEPGCEREVFDAVERIRRISESIGEPMGNVSMAWLLTRQAVTSVIVGGRKAEQASRNAAAGDLTLGDDVIGQLTEATEPVKRAVGT